MHKLESPILIVIEDTDHNVSSICSVPTSLLSRHFNKILNLDGTAADQIL